MKLTPMQLFWLIFTFEIGMTLLLTQSPAFAAAKQDAWISYLLAGGASIIITLIAGKLSLLYPHQTFIEYSQTILGKWLGKIVVIPYFIQWFSIMAVTLRGFADIVILTLFRNTPLIMIIILMVVLMIYVTYRGGLEGIARCCEIMGPVIVLMILFSMLLSYNNIDFKRMLPVFADSGLKGIWVGSIPPSAFLSESVALMMLIPFVDKPAKGVKYAVWGVGSVSLLISLVTLEVVMIFGSALPAKLLYPYFDMARYISVMEFLQNVEIIVIVGWLFSVFVKLSVYLFMASYGTSQWLGIVKWHKLIWFVAFAVILLVVMYPNVDAPSIDYIYKFWVPYIMPFNMIAIPLLLLVVGLIRKRRQHV